MLSTIWRQTYRDFPRTTERPRRRADEAADDAAQVPLDLDSRRPRLTLLQAGELRWQLDRAGNRFRLELRGLDRQ